ncbi:MAG: ectonucleotide pyrophosphatase/phosphodiesterase [Myxococcota bacterium]|nr:ectonucleotide pyrophosphatase/phosphodiesterase [Myxococcota bacterium]
MSRPSYYYEAEKNVVLLCIDGLSNRGLDLATTPRLDELMQTSFLVRKSKGVMPTKSSPNWSSILTGAYPKDHGIHSNQWWWFRWTRQARFPTIFSAVTKQSPKRVTSAVYEWEHFGKLWSRKDVTHQRWVEHSYDTVSSVKETLSVHSPHVLVVHLVQADLMGHEYGWETRRYLAAMSRVDAQVGEILDFLKKDNRFSNTLIIVASDHGGVGTKHGGNSDAELYTPVIINGPGGRENEIEAGEINNVDVTFTMAEFLGVRLKSPARGKPIPWRVRTDQ